MRIALLIFLLSTPALAEVQIVSDPVQSVTRTFDPASRPKEMPPLHASEAAVAQTSFGCEVRVAYTISDRQTSNSKTSVSLKIVAVHMTLRLTTTVWLPRNAPDLLVRHERGHESIGKQLFEHGKTVAEPIAKSLEGRTVNGSGTSLEDAQQAATQSVIDAICSEYLKAMQDRANRVNAEYDRLTDHGRFRGNVDAAVAKALAKEEPATRSSRN